MGWYKTATEANVDEAAKSSGYNVGPVYHGSSSIDIKVFDIDKAGTIQTSDWGKGIYFTPSEFLANGYRDDAVEKTDQRSDELFEEYEEAARQLGTTPMMAGLDLGIDSEEYARLNEYFYKWQRYIQKLSKMKKGKTYGVYLSIHNPYYYVPQSITDPYLSDLALGRGHDSMLIVSEYGDLPEQAQEILVFKASQIKSADPVTYDDGGNVIPLCERFDQSSDDIRY